MTTTLTEFFSAENPVVDPLWTDLADMIRRKAAANPRHLQVELGPSEIGHPCMRKMAFGITQVSRCNPEYDPLPSTFGVAMHTWLQEAAEYDNEQLGRRRWITETRVEIVPGLSGTADLYDCDTHTVIDWKNLGYTSFTEKVKNVGPAYRHQVFLYGKGFARLGYPVKRVAIALLPRSGTLTKMHLDFHDYDEAVADAVLARRETVICMLNDLEVDTNPERYQWFPATPYECVWCPWWRPYADNPLQCSGEK